VRIKVKPNAKGNQLSTDGDGNLVLKVKAPPIDGEANEEVIRFLSEILKIPKSKIAIVSGHTSHFKKVSIETPDEARAIMLLSETSKPIATRARAIPARFEGESFSLKNR